MNTTETFSLLSNPDRRHVVRTLLETRLTTVDDLAAALADAPAADCQTVDQAQISLVHDHLPRLEEYGVIEYDARNGDVVLDETDDLESALDVLEEESSLSVTQYSSH